MGFFWKDDGKPIPKRRPMPLVPASDWRPPQTFPNLASADVIALDVETYDPELTDRGPGWARGKGHIVGIAIGTNDGGRWYFPMRHTVQGEANLSPEHVLAWASYTLSNPRQPKVGANLIYDLGWLRHEGVRVAGELVDVQFAEALLKEDQTVNLEDLAQRYLNEGKETNALYDWLATAYGGKAGPSQRANIYRSPPTLAGPYAESDVDLPLRLARLQYGELVKEGLLDLFRMECALIPLLLDMRFQGVSIDLDRAEQVQAELLAGAEAYKDKIRNLVGFEVNPNASASLAEAFDHLGLKYPLTETGQPSFRQGFLEQLKHPLSDAVLAIRQREKLANTFIGSYLLKSHVNGKVFGQFHPLRSDKQGTRSGRFSSTTPNLQNIPVRSELGRLIRTLFIPDHGHVWRSYDYSQIEYRFLVHFAIGMGAEEARQRYITAPDTDYHNFALDMIAPVAGWDLSDPSALKERRGATKNVNFGLAYGMGQRKLTSDLGLTEEEGNKLFHAYHSALPFVKATMEACANEAQTTGVITTILGRKSRFNFWEPYNWDRNTVPLPYEQAVREWGRVRRAHTHRALNRRLQGSAADLMKAAMLQCYRSGVFDEIGVPRLTVHDELDFSDPGGKDQAFAEMRRIMETAIPLRVPVIADYEIGPNWGELKAV